MAARAVESDGAMLLSAAGPTQVTIRSDRPAGISTGSFHMAEHKSGELAGSDRKYDDLPPAFAIGRNTIAEAVSVSPPRSPLLAPDSPGGHRFWKKSSTSADIRHVMCQIKERNGGDAVPAPC